MEDIIVRRAALDDVDALCDICREGWPGTLLWDGPRFLARNWWRAVFRYSSAETWIWSSGGEIYGVGVLVKDMAHWNEEPLYPERNLFVRLLAALTCPRLVLSRLLKRMMVVKSPPCDCSTLETVSKNVESPVWIRLIAVSQSKRRQGIGRKILQFCDSRTLEFNRKAVKLFVFSDNKPARCLFSQEGFVCTDHRHNGCVYTKVLNG